MSNKTVITIGREYGSGGRDIGRIVAERLQIPYLDREIISQAVKESGLSEEIIRQADEKASNPFSLSSLAGSYFFGSQPTFNNNLSINDQIFILESDIIKKAAEKGPCVIIGRCANNILREYSYCMSVFIHADMEHRMNRDILEYGVSPKKIEEFLAKQDKHRAHYHSYYTDEKWGDFSHYDLVIKSSKFGIEATADLILSAVEIFERQK